jgi:hypothetical protein
MVTFLAAMVESNTYAMENRQAVVDVVLGWFERKGTKFTKSTLNALLENYEFESEFKDGMVEFMNDVAGRQKDAGQIKEVPDFSKILLTDYPAKAKEMFGR